MSGIILLEIEEDIRLAAHIVAKRRGITLQVYAGYDDYKNNLIKLGIIEEDEDGNIEVAQE